MTLALSEHLPLIASAPEGIQKLRGLILELAVRGKLVAQDPKDVPASELLKQIEQKRAQLEAVGVCKKSRAIPLVSDEEQPFDLPKNWAWTNLATVALLNPRNAADDLLDTSFIPMTMIGNRFEGAHQQEQRKWGEIKQGFTHFAEGDIGVAKITPCFENSKACVFAGLKNGIGAGTTELHIVRPIGQTLAPRYVLAYLKAPIFLLIGETKMTGTAGQKRLPKNFLETNPFPLPPLAEQHRIVIKVDELMALCDRLESEQIDSAAAHAQLVETLLGTLTQSTDAADFEANWKRIAEHFDTLFTTEASIDALQRSILQLAIMGKLVKQDPNDNPAATLIQRISVERSRLEATGTLRASKLESLRIKSNQSVPTGWELIPFGLLTFNRDGERIPVSKDDRNRREKIYDYYGASGIIDKIDGYLFDKPLLLIGEDGANLINRSTPIAFIARGKYWVNNHAHVIDAISEELLEYLELYINSINLKPYVTGTAQPKMNQAKMNSIPVCLPPEAEQRRIVAKVNELMAMCDQLKASLKATASAKQVLSATLIQKALEAA